MRNKLWVGLFCLLVCGLVNGAEEKAATDAAPFAGQKTQFAKKYDQYNFKVDGRDCLVVVPKTAAEGKPWIWRTEFFGHRPMLDVALLERGFYVVYINVQGMFGAPVAMKHMDAFYAELTGKYGLSKKTILEGVSRGGLFAYNWAAKNPGQVAGIYGDAPVCDFKSWPYRYGKKEWGNCLKAYGMTEVEALKAKCNPIDNLEPLAKAKIPLIHVVGDVDTVVPVAENTAIIEKRYKELGGYIEVIHKKDCNHHPHGLDDSTPLVDFILKNCR